MDWWQKYIGIPFAEKGRDETGVDCWGLGRLIFLREKQIELPSYLECYHSTQDREELRQTIEAERQNCWIEVVKPQSFDFVLLRVAGVPMHVGLVTKPGHMIHCSRDIGTVHERYDGLRWQNKVAGYFRYE